MERFLLIWDDLDDISAACRHVTFSAIDEVGQISGALSGAIAAFAVWLLR
jgi:hypothetical protein